MDGHELEIRHEPAVQACRGVPSACGRAGHRICRVLHKVHGSTLLTAALWLKPCGARRGAIFCYGGPTSKTTARRRWTAIGTSSREARRGREAGHRRFCGGPAISRSCGLHYRGRAYHCPRPGGGRAACWSHGRRKFIFWPILPSRPLVKKHGAPLALESSATRSTRSSRSSARSTDCRQSSA